MTPGKSTHVTPVMSSFVVFLALGSALVAFVLAIASLSGTAFLLIEVPYRFRSLIAFLAIIGVCLGVVCTLLFLALYNRKSRKGRDILAGLALTGISSLVALALAELVLSLFFPALTLERAMEFSPHWSRPSDILPYELKPGFKKLTKDLESGRTVAVTINSHGLRSLEFDWTKPANTYRILVLGDSFAFNAAMDDHEVHTRVLQGMLNDGLGGCYSYEVINAGYANGYSPDSYVSFMLNRGFDMQPDLVIMQYFVLNDFKDLLETEVVEFQEEMPVRVRSKYRYVDEVGRHRSRTSLKYRIPILRNSHLYITLYEFMQLDKYLRWLAPKLIRDYNGDNFRPNALGIVYRHVYQESSARPPILQQAFDQSMTYVRALALETQRRGIDFVLFIVPTGLQIDEELWPPKLADDWGNPNPQKQILEALQDSAIPIFNPLEFFRQSQRKDHSVPLYLGKNRNGHWTVAGNEVAAYAMYHYLVQSFGIGQRRGTVAEPGCIPN